MKKLLVSLVAVISVVVSLSAVAQAIQYYTQTAYHAGHEVYYVTFRNNTAHFFRCRLEATNGAWYNFTIPAYGRSQPLRINDVNATFIYSCK